MLLLARRGGVVVRVPGGAVVSLRRTLIRFEGEAVRRLPALVDDSAPLWNGALRPYLTREAIDMLVSGPMAAALREDGIALVWGGDDKLGPSVLVEDGGSVSAVGPTLVEARGEDAAIKTWRVGAGAWMWMEESAAAALSEGVRAVLSERAYVSVESYARDAEEEPFDVIEWATYDEGASYEDAQNVLRLLPGEMTNLGYGGGGFAIVRRVR